MLLVCLTALLRGSVFMWGPEWEFGGGRLAEFCRLESLPGPPDRWRAAEGRPATLGQALLLSFREKAPRDPTMLDVWFGGVQPICTENPPSVVSPDYPSAHVGREKAGEDLHGLASPKKIHWYDEGARLPDLRVCPTYVAVKEDKVRVVRDW